MNGLTPNSCSYLIIVILLAACLIVQGIASINCRFVVSTTSQGPNGPMLGLWYLDPGYRACNTNEVYVPRTGLSVFGSTVDQLNVDRILVRTARTMYCLSMLATFMAMVIILSTTCCGRPRNTFYTKCYLIPIFSVAWIAGGLTFLIFAVSGCWEGFDWNTGAYRCTPGHLAWLSCSVSSMVFLLQFVVCCLPRPKPILAPEPDAPPVPEIKYHEPILVEREESNNDSISIIQNQQHGMEDSDQEQNSEDEETPKQQQQSTESNSTTPPKKIQIDPPMGWKSSTTPSATTTTTPLVPVPHKKADPKGITAKELPR
ncbi:expressed unknown protein [Seminavis robusta]|uniref:Uncharacterized protein n=1 Tax=Seminavis robusta TaxID=568900 RepID=A0A9N8EBP4_9STRA|nr:expressed unknown protein [Seminavis robusta]|eukprot:Sro934_g221890.1 n/a (315) ;mRNA; f:27973-28995